jgi:hypothetical protein
VLTIDTKLNDVRTLPPFQFNFAQATLQDPDAKLKKHLTALESVPGLSRADRLSLEASIWSTLLRAPANFVPNIMAQSEEDLRSNKPIVVTAVNKLIEKEFGQGAPKCTAKVQEVKPRVFFVDDNLERVLNVSQQKAHDILISAMLSATELNHRLEDMSVHSSITGFNEEEAPLLFKKLSGILVAQNPQTLEKQLARVETILNLPEISPQEPVNVENLMKARKSSEILEFQAWLYVPEQTWKGYTICRDYRAWSYTRSWPCLGSRVWRDRYIYSRPNAAQLWGICFSDRNLSFPLPVGAD